MPSSALALVPLLLALASPLAGGVGVDVAVKASTLLPDGAPPAPAPEDLGALVPGGLPVDADVSASVELEPVGKTSLRLAGGDAPAPTLPEAIAVAAPPAIAAAGAVALLQAFGGLRALAVGAVALYSRLTRSELLDNGHRDAVYRLVQESPGIALTEIAKRTGLGWGTTVYHLDRLERAQMVASERVGPHRCYFPMGTVPRAARKGIGALKADTTRSVATFLVTRPGATQTELCEGLGLSASAASKQVTKLECAGLVRREREGKTVRLYAADELPVLLGTEGAPAPAAPAAPALLPGPAGAAARSVPVLA